MPIFHLHVKNISRGDERSAVASAAYRAGARLWNAYENKFTDFTARLGVVHSEILAPPDAPLWVHDREQLWNRAEAAEKRKDARLAKEIEAALPRELTREAQVTLARTFAAKLTAMGLVVDLSIHDDGNGNPHVHMLFTTRPLVKAAPDGAAEGEAGVGKKDRKLDSKQFVAWARRSWEVLTNAALGAAGQRVRIDRRSLKAQGIDREPTKHRGPRGKGRARHRDRAPERTIEQPTVSNTSSESVPRAGEGAMSGPYSELIRNQEEIERLEAGASDTLDKLSARDQALSHLRARQEYLIRRVDRGAIDEGLGMSPSVQKALAAAWDQAREEDRRETAERAERWSAYAREVAHASHHREAPPARPWEFLSRDEKRAVIERDMRLDELKAERAELEARIEKVREKRFSSEEERTRRVTPLMKSLLALNAEHTRLAAQQLPQRPLDDTRPRDERDRDGLDEARRR